MASNNEKLNTRLLEDAPAAEDAFGPHKRVAKAIADLVSSSTEQGGKAIGLEGGWGSGKSTVVRFVREQLSSDSNFLNVPFDAWAHEGDPLRRSYLETLVRKLQEKGWIDQATWDQSLEELAKRKKTTTTTITPKPTRLGVTMAISLLLVPAGITLLNASFRAGGGFKDALQSLPFGGVPLWVAQIAGAAFLIAPFLVLAMNLVRILLRPLCQVIWGKQDSDNEVSDWALLFSRAIQKTHTDTTEAIDPTSIEFEKLFTQAMREALQGKKGRRVLLVVDNLDRVDPQDALAIWSTLQTFLQERQALADDWFERVWILAPYDPSGLRQLWESRQSNSDYSSSDGKVAQSFLDKSFQVRFRVPPPVLSDWKSYLYALIDIALPGHEGEKHDIYRVYQGQLDQNSMPPTPRELKLFINQISAVYRQWQSEFPIGHIAYFVATLRKNGSLIQGMRSNSIPTQDAVRLLGAELKANLAGLSFSTDADKGMEFLLAAPILKCMKGRSSQELKTLADQHGEGFWAVLESAVSSEIADADATVVSSVADALHQSGLLANGGKGRPESKSILSALQLRGTDVESWQPFDSQMAAGLSALCDLVATEAFVLKVSENAVATIESAGGDEKQADHGRLLDATCVFLTGLKKLSIESAMPSVITLPCDAAKWLDACAELSANDKEEWIPKLRPIDSFDKLLDLLNESVVGGEFSSSHIAAIQVTSASALECTWDSLLAKLTERLQASVGAAHAEAILLYRGILCLREIGTPEADKTLAGLVQGGHNMHHYHAFHAGISVRGKARCLITEIQHNKELSAPRAAGNSAAGHQQYLADLQAEDGKLAEAILLELADHDEPAVILDIFESREESELLITTCLKRAAAGSSPQVVFSAERLVIGWEKVQKALNLGTESSEETQPFDDLLARLMTDNGLCEGIIEHSQGFQPESAGLYWRIICCVEEVPVEFLSWCKAGLEGLLRHVWLQDLQSTCECVWLAMKLREKKVSSQLTTPLADALCDYALTLVKGEHPPEKAVIESWSELLAMIDRSVLVSMHPRLLKTLVASDGDANEHFYTLFGEEVATTKALQENANVISGLLSPIVRRRDLPGLNWIHESIDSIRKVVDLDATDAKTKEFATRLTDCLSQPEDDDAQPIIKSIALGLGMHVDAVEGGGED